MSTSPEAAAPSLRQLALGDLEHELAQTRRVLERLPDEHLGWKPHPRSWSLGALSTHLANLPYWQTATIQADEFDLAGVPPQAELTRRAEILEAFDRRAAELREAMAGLEDAALVQRWTLRRGEQVLMALPRVAVLRGMGISHMVHHRAQLTIYLRLLDVPVPGLYGPSADEKDGG